MCPDRTELRAGWFIHHWVPAVPHLARHQLARRRRAKHPRGRNGDFGFYPNSFIGGFPAAIIKNGTGNAGIGIPNPTRKLEVAGPIRSSSGGFVFPDGAIQTTQQCMDHKAPQDPWDRRHILAPYASAPVPPCSAPAQTEQ